MADAGNPRYGTPNWDLIKDWFGMAPEDDGPFWAFNLMKYRPLADYTDGRETTLTGREADDVYAPVDILEDLGALVAFAADVTAQPAGDPAYDRVAMVRYPSRAEFFDMQRRPDFIERHEHKDAGMESTIVFSGLPRGSANADPGEGTLVATVRRYQGDPRPADGAIAVFDVEGVIVGDGRTWTELRIERVTDLDAHVADTEGVEEQIVTVLDDPVIDRVAESING